MKIARREFVSGVAALAAGATLGVTASESVRRYGPITIRTEFLPGHPVLLEGSLLTDASRDLFRVYAQVDEPVIAEMSLADMRTAVRTGSTRLLLVFRTRKTITEGPLAVKVDREKVTFFFGHDATREGDPVWLSLADVKKVL